MRTSPRHAEHAYKRRRPSMARGGYPVRQRWSTPRGHPSCSGKSSCRGATRPSRVRILTTAEPTPMYARLASRNKCATLSTPRCRSLPFDRDARRSCSRSNLEAQPRPRAWSVRNGADMRASNEVLEDFHVGRADFHQMIEATNR